MAAKNFMPERAVAQTENAVFENGEEIREQVCKKNPRDLHGEPTHSGRVHARDEAGGSCGELYTRMEHNYLPLSGDWLSRAGFAYGRAVKIRVMPDCIVITPQNTRELWGCLEGLSAVHTNKQKVKAWLSTFPGALNDTGDLPEPKRMNEQLKPQKTLTCDPGPHRDRAASPSPPAPPSRTVACFVCISFDHLVHFICTQFTNFTLTP